MLRKNLETDVSRLAYGEYLRKGFSRVDEKEDIYYLVETSASNILQAYKTKLLYRSNIDCNVETQSCILTAHRFKS